MTTIDELQTLQTRRQDVLKVVDAAEGELDKAHGALRQSGIDFTRLNELLGVVTAEDQRASEPAYRQLISEPNCPLDDLAAKQAARKAVLDLIRDSIMHLAETLIPARNIAVRRAELALAEMRAELAFLDQKIVETELVQLAAPISSAQGKVNISSSALAEARDRAAAAARAVTLAQDALRAELSRQEERKRQRASRGFVSWSNPN